MDSCRDCKYICYSIGKDQFWCSIKEDYVEPEHVACNKFEAKTEGPLEKYIYRMDI